MQRKAPMGLDYEYIEERTRILDEAYAVLVRFPQYSLDSLKEIVIQKHILKNPVCLYKSNFYEIAARNVVSTESYKEIMSLTNNIEKKTVSAPNGVVCPITKKEIVEVFYGDCGHPMEREAAEMLCRSSARPKCPHIGCNKIIKLKKRHK